MTINSTENLGPTTQTLYADYSFQDPIFKDVNVDNKSTYFSTREPNKNSYTLRQEYFIPLDSVINQIGISEASLFEVKNILENSLLSKIYIDPFVDPDLQEAHTKVWEEACKLVDIPEVSTDDNSPSKSKIPNYISFYEYTFAEKYLSTACRRLIKEYQEAIAHSTFSYFYDFRKIVNLLLYEIQYIKYSILNDIGEEYENDSQRQIAVQYDTWAKMAAHYTGRITNSILSSTGKIPDAELDQITKKQAVEFQAFFAIRTNALNQEIDDIIESVKRSCVDNSEAFYKRYVSTSLRVAKDIANPLEVDFLTSAFASTKPILSSELLVATNYIKGNYASILADIIERFEMMTARLDAVIELIKDKKKYSAYITQLGTISFQKKPVIQQVSNDIYGPLFSSIITSSTRNDVYKSSHSDLDDLNDDSHPQYLLKDGGVIIGDIKVENNATIDGVSLSQHSHTGADGSSKIKSTDIDYQSARSVQALSTEYVVKPLSVTVEGFQSDILDSGAPVFDAIISIEVDDLAVASYEYEIIYTEVT